MIVMKYNEEIIVNKVNQLQCPICREHPRQIAFRDGQLYLDLCCNNFKELVDEEISHQVKMQTIVNDLLLRSSQLR